MQNNFGRSENDANLISKILFGKGKLCQDYS